MIPGPPYRQALQAFNLGRLPGSYSWDEMLSWHLNTGFVHSTPGYFIAGRAVDSTFPPGMFWRYDFEFEVSGCDAWYVTIAAGNLSRAWEILPHPLPLIGFDRKGEVRFYPLDRVRRHTTNPLNQP